MKAKNWEVGSSWFLSQEDILNIPNKKTDIKEFFGESTLLSTCRSGIGHVLDNLDLPHVALVPSFTCHTVIKPFIDRNIQIFGYPVKKDLSIDNLKFKELIDKVNPDVILLHGYFGFDTLSGITTLIEDLRKRKTVAIIEDITQTMFSNYGHINSDFKIGSIRKWFPIPDGALMTKLETKCLEEDTEMAHAQMTALKEKGAFICDNIGIKDEIREKFNSAESLLDTRTLTYRMSKASFNLIESFDIKSINKTRRDNYNYLAQRLSIHQGLKLATPLCCGDLETPFMLPIYIESGRTEFQKYMASNNVFPTIIWKCPNELADQKSKEVDYIYNNILCFYVDQRYDIEDMKKVADIVDKYFRSE